MRVLFSLISFFQYWQNNFAGYILTSCFFFFGGGVPGLTGGCHTCTNIFRTVFFFNSYDNFTACTLICYKQNCILLTLLSKDARGLLPECCPSPQKTENKTEIIMYCLIYIF